MQAGEQYLVDALAKIKRRSQVSEQLSRQWEAATVIDGAGACHLESDIKR